jgi:hypothetical protein
MKDVHQMIVRLTEKRSRIDEAIVSLQALDGERRRGRSMGSKNRPKSVQGETGNGRRRKRVA